MAQFDVHRNKGVSRDSTPFVVVVQSSIFEDYRRRVVVPLIEKSWIGTVINERLNPIFRVENTVVVLHPLDIASALKNRLGEIVGSLAEESDRIIAALDEMLMRA